MIVTSLASYFVNEVISKAMFGGKKDFDFEAPLTHLVWITSAVSIAITFVASKLLLGDFTDGVAPTRPLVGALGHHQLRHGGGRADSRIHQRSFVSTNSRHVREVTNCSKHGGASLNILSGFVAGNFSAFWMGLSSWCSCSRRAYYFSQNPALLAIMPAKFAFAAPIFAFGLVAFGFLGMGPVTIAVDSYGPVTDNAQSVYELSQIEGQRHQAKKSSATSASTPTSRTPSINSKKATARATPSRPPPSPCSSARRSSAPPRWCSASSCCSKNMFGGVVTKLSIVQPEIILGLIMGGSVIYWFTGASCQAVVTGAYRAVVYIKENMNLDATTASEKDSKEVVRICTVYAQKGMWNIFIVVFCFALALPFFNPYFFIGYLIGIAFFGLFQAIFMANAGGAWDNAKKIVEVDLRQKGTDLHAATVVGDTVGDPFKGHLLRGDEPGHQVHHALRPARRGNRGDSVIQVAVNSSFRIGVLGSGKGSNFVAIADAVAAGKFRRKSRSC